VALANFYIFFQVNTKAVVHPFAV